MSQQLAIIKSLAANNRLVESIQALADKAQAAPLWDQRQALIALFAALIYKIERQDELIAAMIEWMQQQEEEKNGKR